MNKKWIILALSLLAIVAALMVTDHFKNQRSGEKTDKLGISSEDLLKIDQIKISGRLPEKELILIKEGDAWFLSEERYPVDSGKLARFLDQLSALKALDQIGEGAAIEQEAGLDQGHIVELRQSEKPLRRFEFGKVADRASQYLKSENGPVVLLNQSLQIEADASAWELKDFLKIEPEQIRNLEVKRSSGGQSKKYTYNEEKKTFQLQGAKEGEDSPEAMALARSLAKLSYQSRVDADQEEAKTAISNNPNRILVQLADGTHFEILMGEIGREQKKYYVAIRNLGFKEGTNPSGFLGLLKDHYAKWIFEVNEHQVKRLIPVAS